MQSFLELITRARSYRRFDATHRVDDKALREILEAARLTPSGANRQAVRYYPISDADGAAFMRAHSKWAAYLKDWGGPSESEAPTAWILLLSPTDTKAPKIDLGITAEAIVLAATAAGLGACIFLSIERAAIASHFEIGDDMRVELAIAVGKPCETVLVTDAGAGDDLRYYRDGEDRHIVPKLTLDELIYQVKK